jgi:hypothetical protein
LLAPVVSCAPIRDETQLSAWRETAGGGLVKGWRKTQESSRSLTISPSWYEEKITRLQGQPQIEVTAVSSKP